MADPDVTADEAEVGNAPPVVRVEDLNTTELRSLVRRAGVPVPYYETRARLETLYEEGPEPSGYLHGPMNLIDAHRWAILEWAAAHWDEIYYQINCPLKDEGCTSCPDFTVVSCLIHNRHIFSIGKEQNEMNLTIPGILVKLSEGDKTDTAGLMRELAKERVTDSPGTRLALMKLTRATFDVIGNGTMSPVTDYLGMSKKDMPANVVNFATEGTPPEVLNNLADVLVAGRASSKPTSTEKPAEAEKPSRGKTGNKDEKPYFPGVSEAKDVPGKRFTDDDDDDDDDDAPASSLPRPGQDASQFAKGKDEPEKRPEIKEEPPSPAEIAEMARKPEPEKPKPEKPKSTPEPKRNRAPVGTSYDLLDIVRQAVHEEMHECFAAVGRALVMHFSKKTAVEMMQIAQEGMKDAVGARKIDPDDAEKAATASPDRSSARDRIPEMSDDEDDD